MKKTALLLLSALLTACGSTPPPVLRPLEETIISAPRTEPAAPAASSETSGATSVLIQGRNSKSVLDAIEQNRTRRGMKKMSRSTHRIQFSQSLPKSSIPTEIRMIYQLTAEGPHLRLSAQVLRISNPGRANEIIVDISNELASKIAEELESYAH